MLILWVLYVDVFLSVREVRMFPRKINVSHKNMYSRLSSSVYEFYEVTVEKTIEEGRGEEGV